MKKILITGGAGFIGSNLVESLSKNKDLKIIVIDNLLTGFKSNLDGIDNIEFYEKDIIDLDFLIKITKDVDVICHQAALGSVPRSVEYPSKTIANNVLGFTNIIEAAKINNIKKIVYASSSSVYGNNNDKIKKEENIGHQLSPYALSKRFDEMLARNAHDLYDINFYGLRYFNIFGPKQSPDSIYSAVIPIFIKRMLNNKPVYIHGDGEQCRDFTYIDNAVLANTNLLLNDMKPGSYIYNIGCNDTTSINEIFKHLSDKIGYKKDPIYVEERKGDVKYSLANIEKAKKDFNYEIKVSLEDGLEKTISFLKQSKF